MENKDSHSSKKEETAKEIPYEIPAEGSLGLLALGAVGILAWRKKREELKGNQTRKEKDE